MARTTTGVVKAALYLLAAFTCGVGGVLLGLELRGDAGAPAFAANRASPLVVGDPFPQVDLVDEQGGTIGAAELLGDSGAVVLFLDPECPPCQDMSLRWQRQIDDGLIADDRVLGITSRLPDRNADYRSRIGLTFPILCDPRAEYRDVHGVTAIPYEVVVGGSGRIRATSHDYEAPVDASRIRGLLAE